MRTLSFFKPVLSFVLLLSIHASSLAQCAQPDGVIFVTNTHDEGLGSLREAINCANSTAGPNTIRFNIPGLEDQVIFVGETSGDPLPSLSDPETIIDGSTQPGFGFAGDFTPKIILDGSNYDWNSPINGITITANKCQILGLEIRNFPDDGIEIFQASNTRIGAGNKMNIIYSCGEITDYYDGAPGTGPWKGSGIHIRQNSNNTRIINTIIGSDEDFNTALGNEYCGIRNESGSLNTIIGSTDPSLGNTIIGNQIGVLVNGSYSAFIRGNKMYCNQEDGIKIGSNANFNKLPPVITNALPTQISGTGSNGDVIEIFRSNNVECASGPAPCQGQQLIGTATVAGGIWMLTPPFLDGSTSLPNGVLITANATDFLNNSSAFASCGTVINTATCANSNGVIKVIDKSDAGEGTLRSAILCANAVPGPNIIEFTIQGQGPHINYVGSESRQALPPLLDPGTIIDATTQPVYGLNGNYTPQIILDGSLHNWNFPENALFVQSDHTEIYGLEIRNFPDDGIDVNQADSCIIGGVLKGNVIYHCGAAIDTFPGLPAQGPWEGSGIVVKNNSTHCTIQGNTIGTNFPKTLIAGNEFAGIVVRNGGGQHLIGGNAPGEANHIAHNAAGIYLGDGIAQVNMQHNTFICNDSAGIFLEGTANLQKTPPAIDTANNQVISGSGKPGERVEVFRIKNDSCPNTACQGGELIGEVIVNANGRWTLPFPLQNNIQLSQNDFLTATATDNNQNTSPFSECKEVSVQCALSLPLTSYVPDTCESGVGALQLTADGGFQPYHYALNDQTNTTGFFDQLQSGDYYVTITDMAGCLSIEYVNLPSIGLFPIADFLWEGDKKELTFLNNSYYADSTEWLFPDTSFFSFVNPTYDFDTTGLYEICLVAASNCNTDTICKEVPVFTNQDRLDFIVGKKSGMGGDTLHIPVSVKGFRNMLGFQFALKTDTGSVHIAGVSDFNLPFLSSANFLFSDSVLNCSWSDLSLDGVNIPDTTVIFIINVVLDSSFMSCSALLSDNANTPSEAVRYFAGETLQVPHRIYTGLACGIIPVSGIIKTEAGLPVVLAEVSINNKNPDTTQTDGTFNLIFRGEEGFPSYLSAHKNINTSNGITTFDMVRIQQHLLLLKELDSPYKIIAADVDNNKNVSTFDLTLLRLVILGIADSFPNNESWRFIPASYQFDTPQSPLTENFPSFFTLEKPEDLSQTFDFIGIKVGDVTEDANPSTLTPVSPVNLNGMMESDPYTKRFRLVLHAESSRQMAALQASIYADPNILTIDKIEPAASSLFVNDHLLPQNTFSFIKVTPDETAIVPGAASPLLIIEGQLHNADDANHLKAFRLISSPTPNMAFTDNGEKAQLTLSVQDANVLSTENRKDNSQLLGTIFPNPMHRQATLQFNLNEPSAYSISVYAIDGQLLFSKEMSNASGGLQKEEINRDYLMGAGMYWLKIQTKEYTEVIPFSVF